jgi:hypothetical protein
MRADEVSPNEEHLANDAREFGLEVATAVQNEIEGAGSEERLQAIRTVFLQATDHIEKQYGLESAAMWQDEANRAIQERFATLRPPQDSPPSTDAGGDG